MRTKLIQALTVLAVLFTVRSLAAGQSLSVLPTTPAAVTYRLHGNVITPDGTKELDRQVVLARRGDGYEALISAVGLPDATIPLRLLDGNLTPTDSTTPDDQRSTLEALGFIISLVNGQPQMTVGQSWAATTSVALPGNDIVSIPLTVTAVDVRGGDVNLVAAGSGDGVVRGHGHAAKADIKLMLRASFRNGRVVSATTARTVTAHVIFRTITFTDTWSITS